MVDSTAGCRRQSRRCTVIVPVKCLDEGKSRLAASVSLEDRRALNRLLLLQTLARLARYPGPGATLVVSRSAQVLQMAHDRGFGAIRESRGGLNAALCEATRHAGDVDALAVLPVDMPLWVDEDLRCLVDQLPGHPVCMLVPDLHASGTNLLLQSPVRLDRYSYGPGSLARHVELAATAGLEPRVVHHGRFAFDIDRPPDYERWRFRARTIPVTDSIAVPA